MPLLRFFIIVLAVSQTVLTYSNPIYTSSYSLSCGVVEAADEPFLFEARIIGGMEAKPHAWPWQVGLYDRYDRLVCGGTMITDELCVTAAHCNSSVHFAMLGDVRLDVVDSGEQRMFISRRFVHELYDPVTHKHDIALLAFERRVSFDGSIKPLCLPQRNEAALIGSRCIISGWGVTSIRTGRLSNALQEAVVHIDNFTVCNDANHYAGELFEEEMLCANAQGIDSCQGDSGGPLACYYDGNWILRGIVSWGRGCGLTEFPGVYTNMSNYITWIIERYLEM